MQFINELNVDVLHRILLILCYLLVALGILKIILYLIMALSPSLWEKIIHKENAFYMRLGLFGKKGSETYKKLERSAWTKAFLGCGGLITVFMALIVIALVHWMKSFTFMH